MNKDKSCAHCATTFYRKRSSSLFCSRECRIKATVQVDPTTGCWNWTGGTTWVGYGQFAWGRKVLPAHRHSYLEFHGAIPDRHDVCHKCDNKLCCNPAHLEAGSRRKNIIDQLVRKPRTGDLDHKTVLAIFNDTRRVTDIAEAYGLSNSRVCAIKKGRNFCWLTGIDNRGEPTRRARVKTGKITFNGRTQSARAWSLEIGLSGQTVGHRLAKGWSVEEALSPARYYGGRDRKRRK